LVAHAVVKRAYVAMRERVSYLKRLAFWTIRAEETAGASELFHLTGSKAEDIDVVMTVDKVDLENARRIQVWLTQGKLSSHLLLDSKRALYSYRSASTGRRRVARQAG
jgi:hypothetical protein